MWKKEIEKNKNKNNKKLPNDKCHILNVGCTILTKSVTSKF